VEAFADLPDALVQDLLAKATPVAEGVNRNLQALRRRRPPCGQRQSDGAGYDERRTWTFRASPQWSVLTAPTKCIDSLQLIYAPLHLWPLREPPRKPAAIGKNPTIECGSNVLSTARMSPTHLEA